MENYQRAIDIIANEQLNHRKVVYDLAKYYPHILCELCCSNSQKFHATELLLNKNKIKAIRYCHDKTDLNLHEAKKAVEDLENEINQREEYCKIYEKAQLSLLYGQLQL